VIDPPGGFIVTANQKITPPGYAPFLGVDWFAPYRSDRIEELLAARDKHTVDSFAAIQADVLSRLARDLLPVARAALPETPPGRAARDAIATWDGRMDAKLRAPLVFAEWYRELTRLVYADELGPLFKDFWDLRGTFMIGVMQERDGLARWCDDITSARRETCAEMSARAFDLAAADLERRYAANATWGDAHPAAGDHRPLGFMPWIGRYFNVEPPTPGDAYTVDVGSYVIRDELRPFANTHGPSLRAIYDLADPERSRFIQSTGQSGNVFSPWYRSFAERWAKVQSFEIPTRREAIVGPRMLTLAP
jgi:penicillin amidase